MSYTAIFRDGPLGGQFREVPKPDRRVLVPALLPASYYTGPVDLFPAFHEVEEYELVGGTGRTLEYRWVNPATALRAEVKALKAENEGLRLVIASAKRELSCS
jgi:hypothetical protein